MSYLKLETDLVYCSQIIFLVSHYIYSSFLTWELLIMMTTKSNNRTDCSRATSFQKKTSGMPVHHKRAPQRHFSLGGSSSSKAGPERSPLAG